MDAAELKRRLAEFGWSQKELARKFACDQDTVSRWCTGRTPVPGYVVEYLRVVGLAKEMLS